MADTETIEEDSLNLRQDNIFDRIVLYIATTLFLSTIVFATLQVLSRNVLDEIGGVFDPSLTWTVPAAKMVLIVGSYWGAAVASRNKQHIAIEFVPRKIEKQYPRVYKPLRLVTHLLILGYIIVLTHGLFQKVTRQWDTRIIGLEPMPAGVVYLGMCLAFMIMFIYELINLYEDSAFEDILGGTEGGDTT